MTRAARAAFALAVVTACAPLAAGAQATHPCRAEPAFHALDFWIGDWIVRDASGKQLGHSHVEPVADGCAVHEVWSGAGGGTGQSLSSYEPRTKSWRQHWVDASGSQDDYVGSVDGADVVMTARAFDAAGKPVLRRMRYSPLPDGRVRQLIDESADAGATWHTSFDGYYAKGA